MAIDLYCGLGGWAEGFLAEGYRMFGFDIEHHDYGTGTYPGEFVMQDVTTLHGSQFKDATVIVASPPCQAYSYRAMPWKRAKALPPPDNTLFETCFRLQREASEATCHCECWRCTGGGHCVRCDCFGNTGKYARHIPLIVENVCGAQKWVGRAGWHFGSYYLWGDIPALMPIARSRAKVPGQDWNRYTETGEVSPHWRLEGLKANTHGESIKNNGGSWFNVAPHNNDPRRYHGLARRRASAEIAKIPFPLAVHIARCFKNNWLAECGQGCRMALGAR